MSEFSPDENGDVFVSITDLGVHADVDPTIPVLGIAFAAFCVWLTVRIVNRRERWAKWTLAALVGVPVLYLASFGPACWLASWTNTGAGFLPMIYRPVSLAMPVHAVEPSLWAPNEVGRGVFADGILCSYATAYAKPEWNWTYTRMRHESHGKWEWSATD